ncbi:MAG: SURF1 family protein [Gammaproteobacteria bacterium]|nr:SURF1 family protein [Gammaproteobacteria bacterium]
MLTAVGVGLFAALGMWQLERAAFKDSVQLKFEQRLAQDYQALGRDDDLADVQYRKLKFMGRYEQAHHFLLDNQVHQGRAGYQVITPLYLADSDYILLVNRGWAAWGDSRESLPPILPPQTGGEVSGIAFIPGEPALSLGGVELNGEWPQLIPYVDIAALQQQYSKQLLPMVLWMAPEQPGAYLRDWDPIWLPPEKSRAYAVQWFCFAALALVLFVILNLRKTE